MTQPKLQVKNCDLFYGDFQALKNINLSIAEKEITAFIGPSGCGKSTLLKSLNRMNDLVDGCKITGDFTLDGENIYKDMEITELRKRVGMVFQKPNLFPMSIYDNIAYGPRTHGIKKKADLDEIVETTLRQASVWDETKDRLKKSALGMSASQSASNCQAGRTDFDKSDWFWASYCDCCLAVRSPFCKRDASLEENVVCKKCVPEESASFVRISRHCCALFLASSFSIKSPAALFSDS